MQVITLNHGHPINDIHMHRTSLVQAHTRRMQQRDFCEIWKRFLRSIALEEEMFNAATSEAVEDIIYTYHQLFRFPYEMQCPPRRKCFNCCTVSAGRYSAFACAYGDAPRTAVSSDVIVFLPLHLLCR